MFFLTSKFNLHHVNADVVNRFNAHNDVVALVRDVKVEVGARFRVVF
jgi:hypothetical protein